MNYIKKPILILGAARSGTTMLRSILGKHPDICILPYEVNYVWKYSNHNIPHDELQLNHINEKIKKYIHKQFWNLSKSNSNQRILEKTCANTLRPEFVLSVFPDCQIIHIYRDGRDVAASARKRWLAPSGSNSYLLKKSRSVPMKELPIYASRYLFNRIKTKITKNEHAATWGPRFKEIDECLKKYTLIEVCGIQWKRSIETTSNYIQNLPSEQVFELRYEDFVTNPSIMLKYILDFLDINYTEEFIRQSSENISNNSIGKWKKDLSKEDEYLLNKHINETLNQLGYVKKSRLRE